MGNKLNSGKINYKEILLESVLIMFSVLFALVLSEYINSVKDEEQKEIALQNIKNEIIENKKIVESWMPIHEEIYDRLNEFINNDKIQKQAIQNNVVNTNIIIKNTIVKKIISDVAWITLQNSKIMGDIEFEKTIKIAELYNLEVYGVKKTLNQIIDILRSRETLDSKKLKSTLLLLRSAFHEIISQEIYLLKYYDETLKSFN